MQAFSLCIDEINCLDENSKTFRKITLSVKLNTNLFLNKWKSSQKANEELLNENLD